MKVFCNVTCDFNLNKCLKGLGLNDRGRVQQKVAREILRLSDEYVPFASGALKDSGQVENDTEVVWRAPYAVYMWNGIVYEDPELHCAGFQTEDGWRSRRGAKKVPTERPLQYSESPKRGARWVFKMLQNGGRKIIEAEARKEARK